MELVHCLSCDVLNPPGSTVCQQCHKPLPEVAENSPSARPEVKEELDTTQAEGAAPAESTPPPFEASPEVLAQVERLQQRIAESPDAKALYLQLSKIYVDTGRKDLAIGVMEQLLTVDPRDVYIQHRLDQLKNPVAAPVPSSRGTVASRPRPRPRPPSGPLEKARELAFRRPKLLVLAAAGILLAVVVIRVLFPSTRLIASGEFRAYGAEWSPTGRHFAFLIEKSQSVELAVYDMREGSYRILSDISGWDASAFAWSPDGQRLAYEGDPAEGDWQETIWVADVTSGEARRVGNGSSPVWYLDGANLLVACTPEYGSVDFGSVENWLEKWAQPSHNVCRLNVDTGQSRDVAQVDARDLSFSSVLNKIAFNHVEFDEGALESGLELQQQEFEGFIDRVLSDDPNNVLEGTRDLSRELEARSYMEGKRGDGSTEPPPFTSDVFVMDLIGARPSRITNDGRSSFISWTPDGRRILYQTAGASGAEVWTMNPDGSDRQVVIPASLDIVDPRSVRITADGKYALFVAPVEADLAMAKIMTGESPADVHIVTIGSTTATRLENQHPFKQRYALSPDGKRFVYEVLTDVKLLRRAAHSELWLMSR